jgi:hypothetical protein
MDAARGLRYDLSLAGVPQKPNRRGLFPYGLLLVSRFVFRSRIMKIIFQGVTDMPAVIPEPYGIAAAVLGRPGFFNHGAGREFNLPGRHLLIAPDLYWFLDDVLHCKKLSLPQYQCTAMQQSGGDEHQVK